MNPQERNKSADKPSWQQDKAGTQKAQGYGAQQGRKPQQAQGRKEEDADESGFPE